jgi:hypothetical protein
VLDVRVADTEMLVWLHGLWTRWRRQKPEKRSAPAGEARRPERIVQRRASVKQRLVATATRLLPGWKFQMVVRVRAGEVSARV